MMIAYDFPTMLQVGEDQQQSAIRRVFSLVAQRPDSFCNYLEGQVPEWGNASRIIYRHYATLYFVFVVDEQESELGILDLVQVLIDILKQVQDICYVC